jgi:hypothetical protein
MGKYNITIEKALSTSSMVYRNLIHINILLKLYNNKQQPIQYAINDVIHLIF